MKANDKFLNSHFSLASIVSLSSDDPAQVSIIIHEKTSFSPITRYCQSLRHFDYTNELRNYIRRVGLRKVQELGRTWVTWTMTAPLILN